MKRFLLTLICCSPLVFFPSSSFSLDLVEANSEQGVSYKPYGPISSDETLWGISTKLRPDGSVSVQQTLVAIYKINPDAFYKGDINKIIPGSIIKAPTLEFIQTQTDQEAIVLIGKYSTQKQQSAITVKKPLKDKQQQTPIVKAAEPEVSVVDNLVDKNKLIALENELNTLRDEFDNTNQQLLLVTEYNQNLQLKLQPLSEQFDALKEQLESESLIQEKLQTIIDDYRQQLDAVNAHPFTGEGLVNEILRLITSSLTNLFIVIFSPVLLVLAIFIVIMRFNSKRSSTEQEPLESTLRLKKETEEQTEELEVESRFDDPSVQDTAQAKVTDAKLTTSENEEPLAFVVNLSLDDSTSTLDTSPVHLDLTGEWENLFSEQVDDKQKEQEEFSCTVSIEDKAVNEDQEAVTSQEFALSELEPADIDAIDLATSADKTEDTEQITASDLTVLQDPGVIKPGVVESSTLELDNREQLSKVSCQPEKEKIDHAQPKVDSVLENNFIDIETLLKNSDKAAKEEPYSEFALDLGLDEFPDVINTENGVDIDDDENGVAAQLDLARAYLEIDNKADAKKILLNVVEGSNGTQRVEIEKLLSRLA